MARIIYSDEIEKDYETYGQTEKDHLYNCLDCCVTSEVHEILTRQLTPETAHIYRFERDLQGPVMDMNTTGVKVDLTQRAKVIQELETQIADLDHNCQKLVKEAFGIANFNAGSWQQKSYLLYEVLGLPVQYNFAQGKRKPTTNRDALEKLSINYYAEPICNFILALQDKTKRLSTIKTSIENGRMYTTFSIAGTVTGRFASYGSAFDSGGNLQNWEEAIRRMFIADKGMKFGYIDLEQSDARALGGLCWNIFRETRGESFAGQYLNACESGDVHTSVARDCWPNMGWTGNLKDDKKIAEQPFYRQHSYRHMCKVLGHGTNFYGKPPRLHKETKVPIATVKDFQSTYFERLPVIPAFHTWCSQELFLRGQMVGLLGRPRQFWDRRDSDETLRQFISYGPQNATADVMNTGLINLWRARICQILLQIHDALLIQYPEHLEDSIIPAANKLLQIPIPLAGGRTLVIPTDVKVGFNWAPFSGDNPDGMKSYRGHDDRKRSELSFMDRCV